jgi:redox-regulated HSP33 family molecular chaperone
VSRDFDAQLLESVAVRRRRLRDAVLWGSLRTRRSAPEIVTRLLAGAVVAAVMCAGCVGWSFLREQLAQRQQQQQQQQVGR